MVRATYARVLVRLGGTPPTNWTEALITALCTSADYEIDSFTYPYTISTTENPAIEIAVDVVLRMMHIANIMHESSGATSHSGRSYPLDLPVLTEEIKLRIHAMLSDNTYHGAENLSMIEE